MDKHLEPKPKLPETAPDDLDALLGGLGIKVVGAETAPTSRAGKRANLAAVAAGAMVQRQRTPAEIKRDRTTTLGTLEQTNQEVADSEAADQQLAAAIASKESRHSELNEQLQQLEVQKQQVERWLAQLDEFNPGQLNGLRAQREQAEKALEMLTDLIRKFIAETHETDKYQDWLVEQMQGMQLIDDATPNVALYAEVQDKLSDINSQIAGVESREQELLGAITEQYSVGLNNTAAAQSYLRDEVLVNLAQRIQPLTEQAAVLSQQIVASKEDQRHLRENLERSRAQIEPLRTQYQQLRFEAVQRRPRPVVTDVMQKLPINWGYNNLLDDKSKKRPLTITPEDIGETQDVEVAGGQTINGLDRKTIIKTIVDEYVAKLPLQADLAETKEWQASDEKWSELKRGLRNVIDRMATMNNTIYKNTENPTLRAAVEKYLTRMGVDRENITYSNGNLDVRYINVLLLEGFIFSRKPVETESKFGVKIGTAAQAGMGSSTHHSEAQPIVGEVNFYGMRNFEAMLKGVAGDDYIPITADIMSRVVEAYNGHYELLAKCMKSPDDAEKLQVVLDNTATLRAMWQEIAAMGDSINRPESLNHKSSYRRESELKEQENRDHKLITARVEMDYAAVTLNNLLESDPNLPTGISEVEKGQQLSRETRKYVYNGTYIREEFEQAPEKYADIMDTVITDPANRAQDDWTDQSHLRNYIVVLEDAGECDRESRKLSGLEYTRRQIDDKTKVLADLPKNILGKPKDKDRAARLQREIKELQERYPDLPPAAELTAQREKLTARESEIHRRAQQARELMTQLKLFVPSSGDGYKNYLQYLDHNSNQTVRQLLDHLKDIADNPPKFTPEQEGFRHAKNAALEAERAFIETQKTHFDKRD